jgi:hypothetical protein
MQVVDTMDGVEQCLSFAILRLIQALRRCVQEFVGE